MVLDELHELIETLQARIDKHAPALQQSEALTRYALIDPLLRGLGWDTGDPNQVRVEVRFGSGSADYALLRDGGKPRVIVEAKKLGTPLQNAVSQGINYSIEDGILHFALTDGQRWELYETHRPVPLAEKLVVKLDVKGSTAETCLNALALWRPSVTAGNVQSGASPVADSSGPIEHEAGTPAPTAKMVETGEEWHRLSELKPVFGSKPAAVRFFDGTVQTADSWANLSAAIVEWLKSSGYLTEQDLPVRLGKAQAYFINTINANGTGAQFKTYRAVDSWFVNANYNAKQQANNARGIVQTAGLNPADFAVKLQ